MSPKISYFTMGMDQGQLDVGRCLAEQDSAGVVTGMIAVPLKEAERRERLRGYAAGILQALSDTRPRGNPAPVTQEEGTAH